MSIKGNILKIQKEIPEEVTLIAVSKTKSNEEIMEAYNVGIRDFGENYVQEIVPKMDSLPKDIRWHLIGHLQKNKVKYVVNDRIYLIHSVDSLSLVKEINKEAFRRHIVMNILLEVNISGENSKFGFKKEELLEVFEEIKSYENINVLGLMTILPNISDENVLQGYFKDLKKLKDKLNLSILSMGMTNDYKIAIKEGSTMVRIGTAIFGERK